MNTEQAYRLGEVAGTEWSKDWTAARHKDYRQQRERDYNLSELVEEVLTLCPFPEGDEYREDWMGGFDYACKDAEEKKGRLKKAGRP